MKNVSKVQQVTERRNNSFHTIVKSPTLRRKTEQFLKVIFGILVGLSQSFFSFFLPLSFVFYYFISSSILTNKIYRESKGYDAHH